MTWPVTNRSNTLQIDYHYLRRQVSKYLFGKYHHAVQDDEQSQECDEVIQLGLMQFYFPPVLPAEYAIATDEAHEWSFMRPRWTFQTEADQRRYPLPENWERPLGNIAYINTQSDFYPPIKITSAMRLRNLEFQTEFTARPEYAAIEPGESTGASPQLQVLVLHPTPDAQYQLSCQYQAVARKLTADQPFPLGGQIHGPVILASIMSAAEFFKNKAHGPLHQDFLAKLLSAILRDHSRHPDVLGYNGNGGTGFGGRGDLRKNDLLYYSNVTYNGVDYSGD